MQPIQYQSCFISDSSQDDEFARRLHEKMRGEKLRVWFAPEDMQGGQKLSEQIDRAIQVNDRLLLVLSEHSLNSEWVQTEIRKVHHAELALGAGLPTPPLGWTAGLPESLETCGRPSAGSGDPRTARQKLFPIRLVSLDRIRDWSCFDADTGKCRRLSPRAAFPLSARAGYTHSANTTSPTSRTGTTTAPSSPPSPTCCVISALRHEFRPCVRRHARREID